MFHSYSTGVHCDCRIIQSGLLGANFTAASSALVQHRVTDDVRGRVTATFMLTWGLMPAGALPMGLVADQIGIQAATAGGAMICLAITAILALRSKAVMQI